jgi:predicted NAD/FAD-binding protein
MSSIAIIGTGIAGLACGYFLHGRHRLQIYEKNHYIGGHTNTVSAEENGRAIPIDAGFIVYNETTYPNLTRLFRELNVETAPSSMTFSVQHLPSGLEFCGTGLNGLFSQRKNLLNPRFIRLLLQINRFNRQCLEVLDQPRYAGCTLIEYVRGGGYSEDFAHRYLLPMSSAIWSAEPEQMLRFPAATLVRFFRNHGLLGLNTHYPWRTVVNGSWSYRDKLIAPFKDAIHVNRAAVKVFRERGKAVVLDAAGVRAEYDRVILACHADQALALLADPSLDELRLLKPFRYQRNRAVLHTDASSMPKTRRAWSSWNYRMETDREGRAVPSTTYYMNSLQPLATKRDYFVSINDPGNIAPETIRYEIEYEHPIYSLETMAAQKELPRLNRNGVTGFCGSYFNYGFHEDALTSALDLCRALTGERLWS